MAKIKTNLSGLPDADLLLKGSSIVTAMTGNTYFTAPFPPLADVRAALDAFDVTLQNMVNGGKDKTMVKNKARAAVLLLLANLGMYVQIQSNGDELVLQSTAYTVVSRRSLIGILSKPVNFTAKSGEVSGSIKLGIQAIDGAKSYMFEYTTGPVTDESVWAAISSSKASIVINDLVPGQQYFFRAVGIGTNPAKVYSDVISSYVM